VTATFTPQLLGRAENALRALLLRTLAGSGVGYEEWVLLAAVIAADAPRAEIADRTAHTLRIDPARVDGALATLVGAGFVTADSDRVRLTPDGRRWLDARRAVVAQNTAALLDGVPADDLAVAGRVLAAVTARADALLATASAPS